MNEAHLYVLGPVVLASVLLVVYLLRKIKGKELENMQFSLFFRGRRRLMPCNQGDLVMSECENTSSAAATPDRKSGFFERLFGKLDKAMKEKAEEKAKDSCCGDDGKGGKCC